MNPFKKLCLFLIVMMFIGIVLMFTVFSMGAGYNIPTTSRNSGIGTSIGGSIGGSFQPVKRNASSTVDTGTGTGTGSAVASAAPSHHLRAAYYQTASASNFVNGDAGTKGKWYDSSGNNYTLTTYANGTAVSSTSNGVSFDGSANSFFTSDMSKGSHPITIIAKLYRNNNNHMGWVYDANDTFRIKFYWDEISIKNQEVYNLAAPACGSWGTWAVVFDGANSAVWWDNVKRYTGKTMTDGVAASTKLNFFARSYNTIPFNGHCKGMLVYDCALSDAELASMTLYF